MAGISARTLRYYDEIGLLKPQRALNGYRSYDADDVRVLQYILLLRACQVPLSQIAAALQDPQFELTSMLSNHLSDLRKQRSHLEETIAVVQRALAGLEAFEAMNDQERFEELKQHSVAEFEDEYGHESRQLYGDEAIDAANERILTMSKAAWDAKEELEQRIKDNLTLAMDEKNVHSELARLLAEQHAQWIRVHWGENAYTPDAHVALAEGYLQDPRFIAYYDKACGEGATELLCAIIKANIH